MEQAEDLLAGPFLRPDFTNDSEKEWNPRDDEFDDDSHGPDDEDGESSENATVFRPKFFPNNTDKPKEHISREEERRLVALAKGDNPREKQIAIAALLEAHKGFLWKKVFARKGYFSANITPEDLLQEATMGLMHAIKKFDPERGNKLLTYAEDLVARYIDSHIQKTETTQSRPVNPAPSDRAPLNAYNKYMKLRHRTKGDEPLSAEERQEIFELTGKWPHEIRRIYTRRYDTAYSLNIPIGDKNDDLTFLDTLTEGPFAPPDALAEQISDNKFLESLLENAGLTEKERLVIFARFGIGTDDEKEVTLEALGKKLKVTRERIRQIEARAMEKLTRAARRASGNLHQARKPAGRQSIEDSDGAPFSVAPSESESPDELTAAAHVLNNFYQTRRKRERKSGGRPVFTDPDGILFSIIPSEPEAPDNPEMKAVPVLDAEDTRMDDATPAPASAEPENTPPAREEDIANPGINENIAPSNEEIITFEKGGKKEMASRIQYKTLQEIKRNQRALRPPPIEENVGTFFDTISPTALTKTQSMYQLPLYIEQQGRPIALIDKASGTPRGFLVLPETAKRMGEKEPGEYQNIGDLRLKYAAYLYQNRAVWFKEGCGKRKSILVLLPATREITQKLESLFTKGSSPDVIERKEPEEPVKLAVPEQTETPHTPPSTTTTALVPAEPPPLAQNPAATNQPTSLVEFFNSGQLLPDDEKVSLYVLENPEDLTDTVRVLLAAASEAVTNPPTPVCVQYPNGSVLVSTNPYVIKYLLHQAETEQNAAKIDAGNFSPRNMESAALLGSFALAAKGGVGIAPVDGMEVAILPDDGRFEEIRGMQAMLSHAFPQPQTPD